MPVKVGIILSHCELTGSRSKLTCGYKDIADALNKGIKGVTITYTKLEKIGVNGICTLSIIEGKPKYLLDLEDSLKPLHSPSNRKMTEID